MESPETTYFRKKYNSLSSAWRRFTVLFGMGRSGSTRFQYQNDKAEALSPRQI